MESLTVTIAAHCENRELLKAMRSTLVSMGITDRPEWNDRWQDKDVDHLLFVKERGKSDISFHNHTGNTPANNTYELPAQWDAFVARVVKENKSTTAIKLGGYEAMFSDTRVSFGCQTYTAQDVTSYRKLLTLNGDGASIVINGDTVTAETLDLLLERMTGGYRIGDILKESVLQSEDAWIWRDSGRSWNSGRGTRCHGDRVIEAIEMKDGKLAALISGTLDVWIAIESLPSRA